MSHAELVEFYVRGYPERYLDGLISLFATKLNREDLRQMVASFPARRNRGHLRRVLCACTLSEIGFVGW